MGRKRVVRTSDQEIEFQHIRRERNAENQRIRRRNAHCAAQNDGDGQFMQVPELQPEARILLDHGIDIERDVIV